ncbi:hypothetical protein BHM03_00024664 [Ensete ventricosum]|uniref:Uncharacterized protein n=1 Tax=Ensete ventricosum TaxID=4639 RepID=A0A445MGT5_ENSVE|nr:hypothetical protein BHM03_00024664 [Ensete ventricosum]
MEIAAKQKFGDYLLRIKLSDHSSSYFTVESQTWALCFFLCQFVLGSMFQTKSKKEKKRDFFCNCAMHNASTCHCIR